jgi:sulfate adenylyltransferase subunit 2
MLDHLQTLESQSIYIIREAYNRLERLGMLWSLGKNSNVMLWLCRKAFFGHVPFPVGHVDTEKKFAEMYAFRDRYTKEWGLNLIVGSCPPIEDMDVTPCRRRRAPRRVRRRSASNLKCAPRHIRPYHRYPSTDITLGRIIFRR